MAEKANKKSEEVDTKNKNKNKINSELLDALKQATDELDLLIDTPEIEIPKDKERDI